MRIERIDDKTAKCSIKAEELLKDYNCKLSDLATLPADELGKEIRVIVDDIARLASIKLGADTSVRITIDKDATKLDIELQTSGEIPEKFKQFGAGSLGPFAGARFEPLGVVDFTDENFFDEPFEDIDDDEEGPSLFEEFFKRKRKKSTDHISNSKTVQLFTVLIPLTICLLLQMQLKI